MTTDAWHRCHHHHVMLSYNLCIFRLPSLCPFILYFFHFQNISFCMLSGSSCIFLYTDCVSSCCSSCSLHLLFSYASFTAVHFTLFLYLLYSSWFCILLLLPSISLSSWETNNNISKSKASSIYQMTERIGEPWLTVMCSGLDNWRCHDKVKWLSLTCHQVPYRHEEDILLDPWFYWLKDKPESWRTLS